jgi:hypothetical protein
VLFAFSGVLGGHCFFFPPKKIPGGLQAAYGKYQGLVADIIQSGIAMGEFQKDITVEDLAVGIVAIWDATGTAAHAVFTNANPAVITEPVRAATATFQRSTTISGSGSLTLSEDGVL